MSLKMNPDPRKAKAKQAAAVLDRETEDALDQARALESLDDYEDGIIEAAKAGDWTERPNPFSKKAETVVEATVVETPEPVKAEPEQKTTQAKQEKAKAEQTDKAAAAARIDEALDRTDNFLDFLEEKYAVFGGDPEELREIREEALSGIESEEDEPRGDKKSAKPQKSGKTGKSKKTEKKPTGQEGGSSGGGDKMAERKLTEGEIAKLDPIVEQILETVKDVAPSHQDEVLKAAQNFVVVSRRNKISPETQVELLDLYREVEGMLAKSEKADKQSQEKAKNRQRVLGL